jgi:hypothetical protein
MRVEGRSFCTHFFVEPQIPCVPYERRKYVTAESLEFHPEKHRKHMGMVYFQRGESSIDKLIEVQKKI